MAIGILVCGLNGSGKSTLGKELARALGYQFMDDEELFFLPTDARNPYAAQRSREAAEQVLRCRIHSLGDFVLASVKGCYDQNIISLYRCAVLVEVPKEIRLKRVQERSYARFGARMLPGGDLYEREQAFLNKVAGRGEHELIAWVESLPCPALRVDGTKSPDANVAYILRAIKQSRALEGPSCAKGANGVQ